MIMCRGKWRDSSRKCLRLTHFGMNALGLVFTLLGAVTVNAFKYEKREFPFLSLHGWIGFLGILLYQLYFLQVSILLKSNLSIGQIFTQGYKKP
jgi:hypothetical protein